MPGPAEPADDLITTAHSITVDGERLTYTATAGRIVLRTEGHTDDKFDGAEPKAEVFITSYVVDGGDKTRPVTFAFNGGPGSSSIWLHLGLLGPRRVLMGDVGDLLPPPYDIGDNEQTLLASSDLVFIDPVSTGYSRAVKGGKSEVFHGFGGDIDSVGEVIRLWTSRHDRWTSPKYLCGESYGTTRAAGLARRLQDRYGMYLNGLILVSPFLDGSSAEFSRDNDSAFVNFLPTYAAVAHYHGKLGDRSLRDVLDEAERFASDEYQRLLDLGSRITPDERRRAIEALSALTGLSSAYLDHVNLRPEHVRFLTELLRDQHVSVGRLDGRFTGWEADYGRERWADDPSSDATTGPYAAVFNHYVRAELGYESDLPYAVFTDRVYPWSYREFQARHVYVLDVLSEAMRTCPQLRVHVDCGYYDLATPYFASERDLAHLAISPELATNIEIAYYESGHMMYVHEPSRLNQAARLARFVTAS